MSNGTVINLKDAQVLIDSFSHQMPHLISLANTGSASNEAKGFVRHIGKNNAFLIDTSVFKQLKDAPYLVVFLGIEGTDKPTVVLAKCKKEGKDYTVPDAEKAAIEHVPITIISVLHTQDDKPANTLFTAQL